RQPWSPSARRAWPSERAAARRVRRRPGPPGAGLAGAPHRARASGDDVRQQLAFEPQDLILEKQLALLQALDLQLVERAVPGDLRDHIIQVAMLNAQVLQTLQQSVDVAHRCLSIHASNGPRI